MYRSLFLLAFSLACAAAEPVPDQHPTTAQPVAPRAVPPFDAKGIAQSQLSPGDCESVARSLRTRSPDEGWAVLNACADRRRWPRGGFTQLEALTNGNWDAELQNRPDAPRLIAKVIANRGGDVDGDIPLIQGTRVPLFTLASAVKQPRTYKGRWIMIRGAASQQDDQVGSATIMIKETSLRAGVTHDVRSGDLLSGSGRYGGDLQTLHAKTNNDHMETGLVVVGKLPEADPFIEPGKDFIFYGRFDGIRPGTEAQPVAMVTVGGYFRPSDLMLQ
jgi:hypothetical protein